MLRRIQMAGLACAVVGALGIFVEYRRALSEMQDPCEPEARQAIAAAGARDNVQFDVCSSFYDLPWSFGALVLLGAAGVLMYVGATVARRARPS